MPETNPTERRRRDLLIAGLVVSSVILLLMAGLAFRNTRRISSASFWVSHTWEVKAALHEVSAATERALLAQRNFVLTKQPQYLEHQKTARAAVDDGLKRIAALTHDNAAQQENVQLLTNAVRERRALADEMIERARSGGAPSDPGVVTGRDDELGEKLRTVIGVMEREEDRLLALRRDHERRQSTRSYVILGALLLLNFATIGVVAGLVRRVQSLERLVTICAWSRLLKHGDEWVSIEQFLEREYGVSVTHGMSEAEMAKFEKQMREAKGV